MSCQILVVDDDPSIVNILETNLAHEKHPHLIIMDVMMPKCNGILATVRIRQESSVPILSLN